MRTICVQPSSLGFLPFVYSAIHQPFAVAICAWDAMLADITANLSPMAMYTSLPFCNIQLVSFVGSQKPREVVLQKEMKDGHVRSFPERGVGSSGLGLPVSAGVDINIFIIEPQRNVKCI